MSSPPPRNRRGAHRTGRSAAAALIPSLLAVLAVTAMITSLAVWRGEDPVQPKAAASTTTAGTATREALSTAPSSTPSTTTPAASAESTAPPTSAEQQEEEEKTEQPVALRDVEVVVLNQTSRGGLAGSVADVLRGKGWTVPAVGNFHGVVPDTTVYYPPGEEVAAQAAAENLPIAPRIRPRFGNLSTTRLTVVVTDSYPG